MKYRTRFTAQLQGSFAASKMHGLVLGIAVAVLAAYLVFSKEFVMIIRYMADRLGAC